MKLMWSIKSDNIFNENNKKKYSIKNQIIKENKLLRNLYFNKKDINMNIILLNNKNNNKKIKEKNNNKNNEYIINKERLEAL